MLYCSMHAVYMYEYHMMHIIMSYYAPMHG